MNPSTETSDIPQDVLRAAANRVFEFETAVQSGQFNDDPDGVGAHDMLTLLFARAIMAAKAEEREACATAAEVFAGQYPEYPEFDEQHNCAIQVADAIRKRGEG